MHRYCVLQLCELYCIAEFVFTTMQNEDGNVNLVKPLSDSNCVMKVSIHLHITSVFKLIGYKLAYYEIVHYECGWIPSHKQDLSNKAHQINAKNI